MTALSTWSNERFTLWLVANHGVVSSSMRDPFSAGGQGDLEVNGGGLADRMGCWRRLVSEHARKEKFDVPGFLKNVFGE